MCIRDSTSHSRVTMPSQSVMCLSTVSPVTAAPCKVQANQIRNNLSLYTLFGARAKSGLWDRMRAVRVGLRRTVFVNTVLIDTIDLWWCDTSRTQTTARLRSWFARARFTRASQTIRSGTVYRYMPLPRRQTPYSGNSLVYAPIMIESYFPPAYGLHRFLNKYHIFGFPSTFWAFWPKYIGLVRNIQGSSFL